MTRQSRRATCSIVCDSSRRSVGSLARHLARVGSASTCVTIIMEKIINRKARFNYQLGERIEAG
ncbi:MAG: hypothetical protein U0946_00685, partial [Patescibacteria group bacterium]|nr:hypothetical protein [Patescibacteria group bacterium]